MVEFISTELNYSPEEVIPGLMAAMLTFALMTTNPQQALDEAVRMMDKEEPQS